MIISTLINFFLGFLTFIFGFLPAAVSLPVAISSGLMTILTYVHALDFLIPFDQLMLVFLFSVGFQISVGLIKLIMYVVALLRGK